MGVGACYMTNLVGQAARVRLRQHFGRLDCLKAKQVLAVSTPRSPPWLSHNRMRLDMASQQLSALSLKLGSFCSVA